jgi:hypothetical protein
MTDTGQCETPMSDHIERFWQLLATEHVRILIDIRRNHDEGQPPHWDSASFPDDVAKALVAQRNAQTAKKTTREPHSTDSYVDGSGSYQSWRGGAYKG